MKTSSSISKVAGKEGQEVRCMFRMKQGARPRKRRLSNALSMATVPAGPLDSYSHGLSMFLSRMAGPTFLIPVCPPECLRARGQTAGHWPLDPNVLLSWLRHVFTVRLRITCLSGKRWNSDLWVANKLPTAIYLLLISATNCLVSSNWAWLLSAEHWAPRTGQSTDLHFHVPRTWVIAYLVNKTWSTWVIVFKNSKLLQMRMSCTYFSTRNKLSFND